MAGTIRTVVGEVIGRAIGVAICEPQLRLGRRRHDNVCDHCGEPCGRYAMERLDFPLDDLSPDATSSREKLRAMFDATYRRICLECSVDLGDSAEGGDPP